MKTRNKNFISLAFFTGAIYILWLLPWDEIHYETNYSPPDNFVIAERLHFVNLFPCIAAVYSVESFDIDNPDAANQGYSKFVAGGFDYKHITPEKTINDQININLSSAEYCLKNHPFREQYFELHANPNSYFAFRLNRDVILFYNPDTKILFQLVGD